jgi:hypothetical protein
MRDFRLGQTEDFACRICYERLPVEDWEIELRNHVKTKHTPREIVRFALNYKATLKNVAKQFRELFPVEDR